MPTLIRMVLLSLWPFTVCVYCVSAEQPGTAHWVTNEAGTQCSAIALRRVMIHYLGVIKKKGGEMHTRTQKHTKPRRELSTQAPRKSRIGVDVVI